MGRSKKFLKDVSKEAVKTNESAFSKIKNLFSSNKEEDKEKKRKALIEKERKRTFDEMKNKY